MRFFACFRVETMKTGSTNKSIVQERPLGIIVSC